MAALLKLIRYDKEISSRQGYLNMVNTLLHYLGYASTLIGLFAVLIVLVGLAYTGSKYVFQLRRSGVNQNFRQFKRDFGSLLTLGLEIIVIADVIKTITKTPTIESLSFLALLVIIRTIVSWSLALDIKGCWPWKTLTKAKENA